MASVIVVVIIFVLLALAILFICQNGGFCLLEPSDPEAHISIE